MALHYSGGHFRDETGKFVSKDRAVHSSVAREEKAAYDRELRSYERVMEKAAKEERAAFEDQREAARAAEADRDFAREVFGEDEGGEPDLYPERPRETEFREISDLGEFFEQEHEDIELDIGFDLWDAYDYWDEYDDEDYDEGKSP